MIDANLCAAILLGDRGWLLPAAGVLIVAALILWAAYRRTSIAGRVRAAAASLKIAAFLILAACLVQPLWSSVRARPGANIFLVLADNSQSLSIRDDGENRTRGEQLAELLETPGSDRGTRNAERGMEKTESGKRKAETDTTTSDPRTPRSEFRAPRSQFRAGDRQAPAWQTRLAQDFDLRRYAIDSRLKPVDDFGELTFDGTATSLGTLLQTLRERYRGRPLGGILLFTDGNATDVGAAQLDLAGLPPIYPVLVGREGAKDIAIDKVSISQTSFEDAPVTIQADVKAIGFDVSERSSLPGQSTRSKGMAEGQGLRANDNASGSQPSALGSQPSLIVAQILDEAGSVVKQLELPAGDGSTPLPFRFQLKPAKPGLSFYTLRVAAKEEMTNAERGTQNAELQDPLPSSAPHSALRAPRSSEATYANNSRLIEVDRGAGPHRVLYLTGRPNWELKFLRRAVEEDEQVDLVALVRVARREPKFDFRGRAGESSNPLFRGFKKESDEETERYDQPVLVRLNTKDADELRDGFPKRAEDLYGFRAIIIDDLEADFFTHDQMSLLEKFVSERGGGLLVLGGAESFQKGNYRNTPVGDMLPVYLDAAASPPSRERYRLKLTRDGWLQPWVRLRSTEEEERQRLDAMPPFYTLNRVRSIKPGAVPLATVVDSAGTEHPALVAQRFGRGRTAALTIGDLWRWQLKRPQDDQADDLGKAWRQMLRWLVVDVPDRIDVRPEPHPELAADAVRLKVRVRDPQFRPLDNAAVKITVQPPPVSRDAESSEPSAPSSPAAPSSQAVSGDTTLRGSPDPALPSTAARQNITLDAQPSLDEPGVYEAVYVSRQRGPYRAEVSVTDGDGNDVGSIATGWTSDPAAAEFRTTSPNRAYLEQLAERTGGELLTAERLDEFAAGLSSRVMPVTEAWTSPLWDRPWVFLLAIGCLVGEWGLRRWKGLS